MISILRGDARSLPLPDACIDLIMTSPPYWQLRSYSDQGEHYEGQIGSEPTPGEYLDNLLDCTREWMRVLKPSGSIFVNCGDKYANDTKWDGNRKRPSSKHGKTEIIRRKQNTGFPPKSLMGLPWRYAIRCIDELGLILRAEIIWEKVNGLPESVTDRVRRSHEQVFHFTKQQKYFTAVDEIREPYIEPDRVRSDTFGGNSAAKGVRHAGPGIYTGPVNSLGKLPGSVWSIPSSPLKVPEWVGVDHFAAYPPELCRRIILGWSPSGICMKCSKPRRPIVDKPGLTGHNNNPFSRDGSNLKSTIDGGQKIWNERMKNPDRIIGYACACPDDSAPTSPSVVLDPFGGTGTTAMTADVLGRNAISVDMSMDYCKLASWRVHDPVERAKVLKEKISRKDIPPRDQPSLFEEM